jgi:hypothetical protein
MKTIKYIACVAIVALTLTSCSKDDEGAIVVDPMENYFLINEITDTDHNVELYSEQTNLTVGYNPIFIRIKDLASNNYIANANLSWQPMMHMETMMHSAPASAITATDDPTVFTGYIVFQMPGNATEYWDITLNYSFGGELISKTERVEVMMPSDGLQKTQVFMGSDEARYILAYVAPKTPEVTINDFTAVLYKMENMMTFNVVENFKVTVDPRMPGMGNHSSPNNEDLVYSGLDNMYHGKLSLTMTGYWRINLKLLNDANEVLKGEDITDTNLESSLFFELEL